MLVRSTLVFGPAIVLPRLAAFAVVLLLTHTLAASEFGLYALVLVVGEMLDMVSSNWIRFSLLRLDISRPSSWRSGFHRSYVLALAASALACSVAFLASLILSPDHLGAFFVSTALYIVSNGILRMGTTSLQMRQKNLTISAIESSRSILQVAAVVAAILLGAPRNFFVFNIIMSSVAIVAGAIAIYASRRGVARDAADSAGYRERMTYGMPLIMLAVMTYIVLSSDRILLKLIAGASMVGLYSAAYVFGRQPIEMISNAINQGGFPELMKRYDAGGAPAAEKFLTETLELYALLVLTVLATVCSLAPTIAATLLPPAYRAHAPALISLIALAATLQSMKAYVFDNVFHMFRRNWEQCLSYVPAAIATAVAAVILIRPYGPLGAAVAASIGMAAGLTGSILMTRGMLRPQMRWQELAKSLGVACAVGASGYFAARLGGGKFVGLFLAAIACGVTWLVAVWSLRPAPLSGAIKRIEGRLSSTLGQRGQALDDSGNAGDPRLG